MHRRGLTETGLEESGYIGEGRGLREEMDLFQNLSRGGMGAKTQKRWQGASVNGSVKAERKIEK